MCNNEIILFMSDPNMFRSFRFQASVIIMFFSQSERTIYEVVSKIFQTDLLERELQIV
jgi:hypothetical protein